MFNLLVLELANQGQKETFPISSPINDLLSSPQLWAVGVLVLFVYFVFNISKMLMEGYKEEKINVSEKIEKAMKELSESIRDVSKSTNNLMERQCDFMGRIVEKNNSERNKTQEYMLKQTDAILRLARSVEEITGSINSASKESRSAKELLLEVISKKGEK
jgi:methyl-accepting chemotaxis protein